MRKTFVGWLVVAAALSCPAPGGSGEARGRRIPLRVVGGRLLIVNVTVNATGPYPFLLDTGATSSMVDEELADGLGLPRLGPVAHESSVASRCSELVRGTVTLGGVRREGGLIRDRLAALQNLEPAPRGVVGQDLLRLGNWWLDYRGSSLVEDADGVFSGSDLGEQLPVHWHEDRPAIDAVLPDHRRLRLVLDSGASAPVLFRRGLGDFPPGETASAVLTTLHGPRTVAVVSVGPLGVGRASIAPVEAALLGDTTSPRAEDGLLPTGLFQGIYFDNRAGSVVLNPRRALLPDGR
jgi:hypothetical protein